MDQMTIVDQKNALRKWLGERSKDYSEVDIKNDTLIIEHKVIRSIDILDLIIFLETLRGNPIDIETLKPGSFSSIDTIYEKFLMRK